MEEEKYMRRCIELARNGLCHAAPNPMVGAVIVCDGKIIGEGYHRCCGEAHAEVNAIRSVRDASLLERSTIYVSLEPCAHYGKTPPCADLIVEKRIPRIVVGCCDPFAKVAGRGIRKLRDAGREVRVGVLEDECRRLVRRFLTFQLRHRPYVTLKWAESADGYIDLVREGGRPVLLSSPLTSMLAHKRRAEHSAVLVGTRTALLDDPALTVRNWAGPDPVRVVVDRSLALPSSLRLFDGSVRTLVFTERPETPYINKVKGLEYVRVEAWQDLLPRLLEALWERNLQSLLVEGGSRLIGSFLDAGCWDEIVVERAPRLLHTGVKAPVVDSGIPFTVERWFGRDYLHWQREEV